MADPSVFDPPQSYTAAEDLRALPRMLMEGTQALRREPRKWLPPYGAEETMPVLGDGRSDYDARVANAVVEPFYSRSVKRVVGTVLGSAVVLEDDVPLAVRGEDEGDDGWWENIDFRGNNGTVFLREVLKDAAGDAGFSTVLVDFPKAAEGRSTADDERLGLRPFWRHYRGRDVVEATPQQVNGRERLHRIKLHEAPGPEGNARMRVIEAAPVDEAGEYVEGGVVSWVLWERQKGRAGDEVDVPIDEGTMAPHQEIPMAVVYLDRAGFFAARPPQLHLAYLNLKHTRQDGDISDDLSVSSGAQLHRTGISSEESKQRAIGRRSLLWTGEDRPGARAEWLERSGQAAKVYMEYLDRLEAKMERYGNEPHIRRTGAETATGRAIISADAQTEILAYVEAMSDFTEQLLMLTAKYLGEESGGSVRIPKPAVLLDRDDEGMRLLIDMHVKVGVPTRETLLEVAKAQGRLPEDLDVEVELAKVEQKGPPAQPGAGVPPAAAAAGLERTRAALAAVAGNGATTDGDEGVPV